MASRDTYGGSSTGVSGADLLTEYAARIDTLFDASVLPLTSVAGTDTVTASVDPDLPSGGLVEGMKFSLTWASTNTGAVTLNIDSTGDVAVVDKGGAALQGGAITAGLRSVVEYYDSKFRVITPLSEDVTAKQIDRGTAQATTSGSSIDFTNIPSWARRITLLLNDVDKSGASDLFLVQIGDSGGLETTGYSGGSYHETSTYTSSTTGFIIEHNGQPLIGKMTIENITENEWVSVHTLDSVDRIIHGASSKTLSGTLDRLRLKIDGAETLTAGKVNILIE